MIVAGRRAGDRAGTRDAPEDGSGQHRAAADDHRVVVERARPAPSRLPLRPCYCSASPGQVAEWQTRTVQVRVSGRTWGFNSPLAHSRSAVFSRGFSRRTAPVPVRSRTADEKSMRSRRVVTALVVTAAGLTVSAALRRFRGRRAPLAGTPTREGPAPV